MCSMEKVLGDARTLLERLKEHDTAAETLIEQSSVLGQKIHSMKEVGNNLPDKAWYESITDHPQSTHMTSKSMHGTEYSCVHVLLHNMRHLLLHSMGLVGKIWTDQPKAVTLGRMG